MASITRSRVNELTAAEIAAVKLSNRRQYGEYTTWDALSSDGSKTYTVTVDAAGKACGCTCPSTVPCKHRAAAEFEFVWSAPVAQSAQVWHDDDTTAHVEDSIRSGEFEQQAWAIIEAEYAERARTEAAYINEHENIDDDPMEKLFAKPKEPVSLVEHKARKYDRYAVTDMKPFSLLA